MVVRYLSLALALAALGCSSSSSSPTTPSTQYDGETLMRAIYFSDGPAAEKVNAWTKQHATPSADATPPTVTETTGALSQAAARLRADNMPNAAAAFDLMAADVKAKGSIDTKVDTDARPQAITDLIGIVNRKDRTFLQRFAHDVQSGNQVTVDKAVTEGGLRVLSAVATLRYAQEQAAGASSGTTTKSIVPLTTGSGSSSSGEDGNGADKDADKDNAASQVQEAKLSFQMNVHVWYDTAAAAQNVAVWNNTLFWSKNDNGIATASFVDHLTTTFEKK